MKSIYLNPEKGSPFGRSLPLWAIIESAPWVFRWLNYPWGKWGTTSSLSPRLAHWTPVPTRSIQSQAPTLPTAVGSFTESIIIINNLTALLNCRFGIFTLGLVFSILFKRYLQWLVSSGGHKENSRLQGRAMNSFPTVYWHHHRLDGISRGCPFDNTPPPHPTDQPP